MWFFSDIALVTLFGIQHTLLTRPTAVRFIQRLTHPQLWNIIYSSISVVTLLWVYYMWQPSGIQIYNLDGLPAYFMSILSFLGFVFFFYCFKFTTSFGQWLGYEQVMHLVRGTKPNQYYRLRQHGIKRFVRFPHHTALIIIFWAQPAMTLDSLLFAVTASFYTYVGTVHQDRRGVQLIGQEWIDYRERTNILFPSPLAVLAYVLEKVSFWSKGKTKVMPVSEHSN
jgi:methanethiol S-methyltransferase